MRSHPSRQQSVVFFSDIVGYTRLMGEDEDRAFELMKQNLEIHQDILSRHNGQIIKELGDGILATFQTVEEALNASLAIQSRLESEAAIKIRIGLHCGEIIFDQGDVFGDAVNIAARIQGIGMPTCVLFSSKVLEQIPADTSFSWVKLGVFSLKNVKNSVELYALSNPPVVVPKRAEIIKNIRYQERSPWKLWAAVAIIVALTITLIYSFLNNTSVWEKEKSVAVLPFTNITVNSDQEFFAEGLTEDIISQVSKIESIKVISKDAVEGFKGDKLPLDSVAKVLDVTTVLKGSVQWIADKIRINVQLIDPAENRNLWAETYNRDASDIFKVQADIATEIARVLNSSLSSEERSQLSKTQTSSFDAYELHLKGRELYSNYSRESIWEAIDYYKQAIEIDPNYALAYASLADSYAQLIYFSEEDQWLDSSMEASAKALALDPYLAEGFKAQGNVYYYKGQSEYAKISFEKAIVLNPNLSSAIGNLATVYFVSGNLPEALKLQLKSATLNPTNFLPYQISGWIYRVLDQFEESEVWLNRSLDILRDPVTIEQLAFIEIEKGDNEKALSLVSDIFEDQKDSTALDYTVAGTIAFFAESDEIARMYLEKSIEKTPASLQDEYFTSPILLAYILAQSGERLESNTLVEQGIQIREDAIENYGDDFNLFLDLAQLYAIKGSKSESVAYLALAEEKGMRDDFYITHNPIFKRYLKDPTILSVLSKIDKSRIQANQELQSNDLLRSR
ncbi:adenylate/guanylate cyclase domain-containing protein [Algoriphagus formosus]|uniref:Adenylate/guanylate cyclase domain-containing protein n=1 Tax=Algoriphagus formosus TaxID=2007308 RepID=A0A4V3AQ81_9BACT|nr:adenylate/guanylate cyclase domain-containing protein [Algoriphagus aquimaris]TDK41717.1 adenylate/guanylate cyclase domain-containing protein [Algoriphagus aquimaris]